MSEREARVTQPTTDPEPRPDLIVLAGIRQNHRVVERPGIHGKESWCDEDHVRQPCDTQVVLGILDAREARADRPPEPPTRTVDRDGNPTEFVYPGTSVKAGPPEPPTLGPRELTAEEAVEKALLFTFQLSGKDYRKMQRAMSEVAFIRALEQDGYTVSALRADRPPEHPTPSMRLALEDLLTAYHHEQDHPDRQSMCPEPRCQQAYAALAAPALGASPPPPDLSEHSKALLRSMEEFVGAGTWTEDEYRKAIRAWASSSRAALVEENR